MAQRKEGTIDGTGQTHLSPAVSDRVSSYLIHFESLSFVGEVAIKGAALDSAHVLVALAYKNMATGTNATATISDTALVLVDAAGLNIALDCTTYTSGSLSFTAVPLIG